MTCGAVSASWARRLSRLLEEVRRLGTAMRNPFLGCGSLPAHERVQHGEAGIRRRRGTAAGALVQVGAAARAEAAAGLGTERTRGEREDRLLVDEWRHVDVLPFVG